MMLKHQEFVNISSQINISKYESFGVAVASYDFKRVIFCNPVTAKLFNLNFHPLEIVSR